MLKFKKIKIAKDLEANKITNAETPLHSELANNENVDGNIRNEVHFNKPKLPKLKSLKRIQTSLNSETNDDEQIVNESDNQSKTKTEPIDEIKEYHDKLSKFGLMTAIQLMEKKLKKREWTIEKLLPRGFIILGGSPKVGKSWFALNIAVAVASGTDALGYFNSNKAGVLFLAFEDDENSMQERLLELVGSHDEVESSQISNFIIPNDLHFNQINEEGLEDIVEIINQFENTRLVVIDTFGSAFAYDEKSKGSSFRSEYETFNKLHKMAMENNITILLLHHTVKMSYKNKFQNFLGTQAMTAVPDTLILLEEEKKGFLLSSKGRKVPSIEYLLDFDNTTGIYTVAEAGVKRVEISPEQEDILDLFEDDEMILGTGEIASLLGKSKPNISKMLGKMNRNGILERPTSGNYKLPTKGKSGENG